MATSGVRLYNLWRLRASSVQFRATSIFSSTWKNEKTRTSSERKRVEESISVVYTLHLFSKQYYCWTDRSAKHGSAKATKRVTGQWVASHEGVEALMICSGLWVMSYEGPGSVYLQITIQSMLFTAHDYKLPAGRPPLSVS